MQNRIFQYFYIFLLGSISSAYTPNILGKNRKGATKNYRLKTIKNGKSLLPPRSVSDNNEKDKGKDSNNKTILYIVGGVACTIAVSLIGYNILNKDDEDDEDDGNDGNDESDENDENDENDEESDKMKEVKKKLDEMRKKGKNTAYELVPSTGHTDWHEYEESSPYLLPLKGQDEYWRWQDNGLELILVRRCSTWWTEASEEQRKSWLNSTVDKVGPPSNLNIGSSSLEYSGWGGLQQDVKMYLIQYKRDQQLASDSMLDDRAQTHESQGKDEREEKIDYFTKDPILKSAQQKNKAAISKFSFTDKGIYSSNRAKKPNIVKEKFVQCPICMCKVSPNAVVRPFTSCDKNPVKHDCTRHKIISCIACLADIGKSKARVFDSNMDNTTELTYRCTTCFETCEEVKPMISAAYYLFNGENGGDNKEGIKMLRDKGIDIIKDEYGLYSCKEVSPPSTNNKK